MGQVLPLVTQSSVDEAWEAYRSFAIRLSEDASLLADRGFNEQMAQRHEKWRRLFLRQGHP